MISLTRSLLAAIAAFFLSPLHAQSVIEYGFAHKLTQEMHWGYSTNSAACDAYASSHAEWYSATYPSYTGVQVVDVRITVGNTCAFKVRRTLNGNTTTTADATYNIQTRDVSCQAGISVVSDRWGCYIRATDTTPTIAECSGLTSEGSTVPGAIHYEANNCQVSKDAITGLVAFGAPTNGWQAYRYRWNATQNGVAGTPPTPDPIPDPPTTPPNEPPPDDPDDPGDDPDSPTRPLTCPAAPDFYDVEYPDGISGVITSAKNQFTSSPVYLMFTHAVPNYQFNGCPSFTFTMGPFGEIDVTPPCIIWTWIKAIFVISAFFVARRLVFGG